jgi:hypothetical protein
MPKIKSTSGDKPSKAPKAKSAAAKSAKPVTKHTKLHYCDLSDCQGICCSDGAFLRPEEVRRVHKLVEKYPEHFAHLPPDYIVDEEWAHGVGKKNQRAEISLSQQTQALQTYQVCIRGE